MHQLSVWEKESFFAPQDVIIVGSGFCGLWSALHLKTLNPHYNVTILERGIIPTGASTRNAGFSCFGSPSELINDARLMGEDEMWKLVVMRYQGLQEIRKFFSDEEIDYDGSGGYESFTIQSEDWNECKEKLEWLNSGLKKITGVDNVFRIVDEKIAEFGFSGFEHLVENKLEGGLHPGKLVKCLLKKVQAMGVQVMTGIEVLNFYSMKNRVYLSTNHQIEFITNNLLLCTNAFTEVLVPGIDITPNRGQVLITSPIENLKFKGTFHFDKGFYYFRNLNNRLLIGGARNKSLGEENTSEMKTTDLIQHELEEFIHQYLLPVGTSYTITDRWTGIMGMGNCKAPIVSAISNNVYCCVRMSGMGVALAPIVACQAVQLINKSIIV